MRPRIVLAEDYRLLAEVLQAVLEDAGYEVEVAADPEGVTEAAREPVELFVLDGQLARSEPFAAVEALARLELEPRPPILVLSGDASAEARVRAAELGADAYLVKPCSSDELVETAGRLVARAAA